MPATAQALLGRNAECAALDRVLDGICLKPRQRF